MTDKLYSSGGVLATTKTHKQNAAEAEELRKLKTRKLIDDEIRLGVDLEMKLAEQARQEEAALMALAQAAQPQRAEPGMLDNFIDGLNSAVESNNNWMPSSEAPVPESLEAPVDLASDPSVINLVNELNKAK